MKFFKTVFTNNGVEKEHKLPEQKSLKSGKKKTEEGGAYF